MARTKPGTLVANQIAEVQIDDSYPHGITIINLSGSGAGLIWYRLDGGDPAPYTDDSFVCVDAVFIPNPAEADGLSSFQAGEAVKVRLISTAALKYTVEGNVAWKRA
jgi:hypothetical protein